VGSVAGRRFNQLERSITGAKTITAVTASDVEMINDPDNISAIVRAAVKEAMKDESSRALSTSEIIKTQEAEKLVGGV
jgi:hypothetical protein